MTGHCWIFVRKSDDMSSICSNLFIDFCKTTGIDKRISGQQPPGQVWLICFCILVCVWGFHLYRVFSSILFFMGITEVLCFCMKGEPWGTVAVYIAVLGTVIAVLAYRWNRLGGFVVCAALGACMGWVCCPSIVVALLCGIAAGIAQWYFPVITICLITSLWGACFLWDIVWKEKNIFCGLLLAGTAVISFLWQLFINRKQTLFRKPYPDWLRYRLEKRRCA